MPSDKAKVGPAEDPQITVDEPGRVEALAQKHGLTVEEVRDLIRNYGTDPDVLDRAAEQMHRAVVYW